MIRLLFISLLCIPLFAIAQIDSAIQNIKFEEGLTWKQILKKARKENKYIFLDCYTTWCAPCKMMEEQVFNKKAVADFFSQHFISVRVQMDKTKKDNPHVQKWYRTASELNKTYGIPSFPTFLFFSPMGQLIYRTGGFMTDRALITAGNEVVQLQPGTTAPYVVYYLMLTKYQRGEKDYKTMAPLADTAKRLGQNELAEAIAKEYREYLLKKPRAEWFTAPNLSFMANFMVGSKDLFFKAFYDNEEEVDSIVQKRGFAQNILDKIILQEEVWPISKPILGVRSTDQLVEENEEPDWRSLQQLISAKYNQSFGERNILYGRVQWYADRHEWGQAAKYLTVYLKKHLSSYFNGELATHLNSYCWESIFKRSVDKEQVDAAIDGIKKIVIQYPKSTALLDTYANLLYKAGRKEEAIRVQEDAVRKSRSPQKLLKTLERMKLGKPTWGHYLDKRDVFTEGLLD